MKEIFPSKDNTLADNVSSNTRSKEHFYNPSNPRTVKNGLKTLRCLGPKVWKMVPADIRNSVSLSTFKLKIKNWTPSNCPCRLCEVFIPHLGFL